MNSKSKSVLLAGTALVALMLLFPPWDFYDSDSSGSTRAGYHFFRSPPNPKTADFRYKVRFPDNIVARRNLLRLNLQLLVTIPVTLGLAILFRTKRSFITVLIGILFLVTPLFGVAFLGWFVISEGLQSGDWTLP